MTTNVEKSITVEAPVSAVYNQWAQFEEEPPPVAGAGRSTRTPTSKRPESKLRQALAGTAAKPACQPRQSSLE